MKTYYSLILSLLSIGLIAQSAAKIDLNNLECSLSANGSLFQDDNNWGLLKVGGASGKALMYTGHLWLSAKRGDTSYVAAQSYFLAGNPSYVSSDFRYGPIANSYNTAFQTKYNKVWKMNRSMVDHHRTHFNDANYQAFNEILEWPAHGDTANGEAWLLAPFADLNGNKLYEPQLGEYPEIKGDQSLYCIFNDEARYNPESSLAPLGVEVHLELYAFDGNLHPITENAIFLNYRIINRSNRNLETVRAGQWYDSDLGNAFDDLCGSDSVRALSYTYNADSLDEGTNGFGLNPPAVGFSALQGNVYGAMYYNNSGGFSGPMATTDPFILSHWYHYLENKWRDGNSLILENPSGPFSLLNGDGFISNASAPVSHWAYNDQANWYCSPLNNGDKRQLLNFGPQALAPSDTMCLDMVLHFSRDLNDFDPFAAVQKLKQQNDSLNAFWQNLNYTCSSPLLSSVEPAVAPRELMVYPNPSAGALAVNWENAPSEYSLFNLQGKLVLSGNLKKGENQLDINSLKSGIYLLVVSPSSGSFISQKIIKR